MKKRIFAYDIIRVTAMLLVVYYHMNAELAAAGVSSPLIKIAAGPNMNFGSLGVSMFFILSGASQCISFVKDSSIKTYFRKKIINIFPMFYLAYILGHLISVLSKSATGISPLLIWTFLGIDGYLTQHGIATSYIVGEWFLGMLLFMYLVFPLLWYLIRKLPRITGAIIFAYYVLALFFFSGRTFLGADFLIRIVEFAAGIYIGLYSEKLVGKPVLSVVSLLVFVIVCAVRLPFPAEADVFLAGCSLFLFILSVRFPENPLEKPLGLISGYSYPVFLIHHVIITTSLSGRQNLDFGFKGYVEWAVYVLFLIAAAAFLLKAGNEQIMNCFRLKRKHWH